VVRHIKHRALLGGGCGKFREKASARPCQQQQQQQHTDKHTPRAPAQPVAARLPRASDAMIESSLADGSARSWPRRPHQQQRWR
jgi:hypothetical protein